MRKLVIFTPVNPLRPFSQYLNILHDQNVQENIGNCPSAYEISYEKEEVILHNEKQHQGLFRGQNVVRAFNRVYGRSREDFEYICKWDDDMLLPLDALMRVLDILDCDPEAIGAGLFSTQYGAPNILMTDQETQGWTGSFQRFYIYRMSAWRHIEIKQGSGDPDQAYQWNLKGKKIQLHFPHVHLDHRATNGNDDLYRVLLDLAFWSYFQ